MKEFEARLLTTVFAFGQTYEVLFLARSTQGISSACIGVSGMSLLASLYPEEDKRSKIMGFVLGSIALGVLLGYPMGSVLYDLEGKMAPFLLVASFIVISISEYLHYSCIKYIYFFSFALSFDLYKSCILFFILSWYLIPNSTCTLTSSNLTFHFHLLILQFY